MRQLTHPILPYVLSSHNSIHMFNYYAYKDERIKQNIFFLLKVRKNEIFLETFLPKGVF